MRRQRRLLYPSWRPVMGAYAGTRTRCLPTGYCLGGVMWGGARVDGRAPPPFSAVTRPRPGTSSAARPCAHAPCHFMTRGGALVVGGTQPRTAARGAPSSSRPRARAATGPVATRAAGRGGSAAGGRGANRATFSARWPKRQRAATDHAAARPHRDTPSRQPRYAPPRRRVPPAVDAPSRRRDALLYWLGPRG